MTKTRVPIAIKEIRTWNMSEKLRNAPIESEKPRTQSTSGLEINKQSVKKRKAESPEHTREINKQSVKKRSREPRAHQEN